MSAKILDGKIISQNILEEVNREILCRKNMGILPPVLAVILIGDDHASAVYVKNKLLACRKVGIVCKFFNFDAHITEQELLAIINSLNQNNDINAILVQLPLPYYINLATIVSSIDPKKDVDGFHPQNIGFLTQGWPVLQPCTPLGIMKLLAVTEVDLLGKKVTIVGSSNIVGKPMALCLVNAGCTVTICNKNTVDLKLFVANADLLISATGQPHLIKGDWIKPGSIVIDVGISKLNDKLTGDVDFEMAKQNAAWITKVPGGVGPMTIACLLENTLLTQKLQQSS